QWVRWLTCLPSRRKGRSWMARTDLFSFGALLYEMATGRIPMQGNTSGAIFGAILHEPPPPPTRLNPQVPPKLEDGIIRALEKDRDIRYQHASEVRADLNRLKRDTDSKEKLEPAKLHISPPELRHANLDCRRDASNRRGCGGYYMVVYAHSHYSSASS